MSFKNESYFFKGFKAMLPVVPGIVPFGLIMGTVSFKAGLSFFQISILNISVFAGASQLAMIDLLVKDSETLVIIATGIMINLRFLLYSAGCSSFLKKESFFKKVIGSYLLTDQSYAVTVAHEISLHSLQDKVNFFFGASFIMTICWNLCVMLGFYFGNFIPERFSLDFAVPLSFMALTIPTLISKKHLYVAILSMVLSISLYSLPYNLGLIITAGSCIFFAKFLMLKRFINV